MTELIDIYGTCDTIFQPTIDETNELLMVLGAFNRDFAMGADTRILFEGLLANFLKLTNSEYGFIGERLIRPSGEPFLKTHAITNIAWDETTQIFYEEHARKSIFPDGK